MTKEEKSLLLKDLSARLAYGVVYHRNDGANIKLNAIDVERGLLNYTDDIEERECKPYLRSIDDMTEEEEKEICQSMKDYNLLPGPDRAGVFCGEIVEWLNSHYFDYRGLIEKDLAIEVTEENNPYASN